MRLPTARPNSLLCIPVLVALAGLAIVLTALGCFRWMSRRPALRQWLWLLLLAKLVTPPLIPVPILPAVIDDHDMAGVRPMGTDLPSISQLTLDASAAGRHLAETDFVESAARHDVVASEHGPRMLWLGTQPPYVLGLLAVSLVGTCVLLTLHTIRVSMADVYTCATFRSKLTTGVNGTPA